MAQLMAMIHSIIAAANGQFQIQSIAVFNG